MTLYSNDRSYGDIEKACLLDDDVQEVVYNLWEDILVLKEELSDWVGQYGCECGHPSCSRCKMTESARELL